MLELEVFRTKEAYLTWLGAKHDEAKKSGDEVDVIESPESFPCLIQVEFCSNCNGPDTVIIDWFPIPDASEVGNAAEFARLEKENVALTARVNEQLRMIETLGRERSDWQEQAGRLDAYLRLSRESVTTQRAALRGIFTMVEHSHRLHKCSEECALMRELAPLLEPYTPLPK